ncbi:MAG: hypothetical protein ACKO3N_07480, partial [Verrucomicrobiota bacterium]
MKPAPPCPGPRVRAGVWVVAGMALVAGALLVLNRPATEPSAARQGEDSSPPEPAVAEAGSNGALASAPAVRRSGTVGEAGWEGEAEAGSPVRAGMVDAA